jgi:hypothetical protein
VNCFAISSSRDGYYGIVGEHCGILCSRKFVDIDGYLGFTGYFFTPACVQF